MCQCEIPAYSIFSLFLLRALLLKLQHLLVSLKAIGKVRQVDLYSFTLMLRSAGKGELVPPLSPAFSS